MRNEGMKKEKCDGRWKKFSSSFFFSFFEEIEVLHIGDQCRLFLLPMVSFGFVILLSK